MSFDFAGQNQTIFMVSFDEYGLASNDTFVGATTAGQSTGCTSQAVSSFPGTNTSGDIVVYAGTHEADEGTVVSGGGGTWTSLLNEIGGSANASMQVSYQTEDGTNPTTAANANWSTSVPGAALVYQIH